MRTPVMAGNWKMFKTPAETTAFFREISADGRKVRTLRDRDLSSFTNLAAAVDAVKGTNIRVGSQNIAWAKEGAFTGEISATMLRAVGVTHAIIGHSERRQYFGETRRDGPETHRRRAGCRTHADRLRGRTSGRARERKYRSRPAEAVPGRDRRTDARAVRQDRSSRMSPSGQSARARPPRRKSPPTRIAPSRAEVRAKFGKEAGDAVRILYGGSVKPDNVKTLMAQPEIDGSLVGGAALEPVSFASIVNF